jgi:type III pantothenate kinase
MLIAIDIGNSTINIGFFTKSGLLVQKMDTHPLLSPAKYSAFVNRFIKENYVEKKSEGIIISSVVPGHTKVLRKALKGLTGKEPFIVSYKISTGLTFKIPNPEKLGSDRIANAAAAYEFYKCPVAAVDFGTATTISVVDKKAAYIGGTIMPGIHLMDESLAQGTSKLSEVHVKPPISALGKNTVRCIQSGLFYGTAGAVERILGEIEKEVDIKLKIVITGGYGVLISKFLKRKHDFSPHLTLEGLRIIYKRNSDA